MGISLLTSAVVPLARKWSWIGQDQKISWVWFAVDHEVGFANGRNTPFFLPAPTPWNQCKRAAGNPTPSISLLVLNPRLLGRTMIHPRSLFYEFSPQSFISVPDPLSEVAEIHKWKLDPKLLSINVPKANKICIFLLLKV